MHNLQVVFWHRAINVLSGIETVEWVQTMLGTVTAKLLVQCRETVPDTVSTICKRSAIHTLMID